MISQSVPVRWVYLAYVILTANVIGGCSQEAKCRPGTVLVRVTCKDDLKNALVRVHLTGAAGQTSEVLTLGPCPTQQNAEFKLPDYESLQSVSWFADAYQGDTLIKAASKPSQTIANGCSVFDIDFEDVEVVGAKMDASAMPDGDVTTTPMCTKGAAGCACTDEQRCDGELVCVANECVSQTCGNAKTESTEACDDGNKVDTDACRNNCQKARCGDGVVQEGAEECDEAAADNLGPCLMNCKKAKCGDGFVQKGVETCDDGNTVDTDSCTNTCKSASCGDGKMQPGEECDDGNQSNTDSCLNDCKKAKCGDGFVQANAEECDDGNSIGTDSCSNLCKAQKPDGQSCSAGDECSSGVCKTYFKDRDGDGFGANPGERFCGMSPPSSTYKTTATDCCDTDLNAFPGQQTYFKVETKCGGFDFDCESPMKYMAVTDAVPPVSTDVGRNRASVFCTGKCDGHAGSNETMVADVFEAPTPSLCGKGAERFVCVPMSAQLDCGWFSVGAYMENIYCK